MSRSLNYSKWDRLEVSDDEKDAHPNIDSSLMIRIKREQRARREAEELSKIAELRRLGTPESLQKIEEIRNKSKLHVDNICRVVDEKTIVNHAKAPTSSNIGTTTASAGVSSSSTSSQSSAAPLSHPKSEDDEFEEYIEKNEDLVMEFASMRNLDVTKEFMLTHPEILNEHACSWLLLHQLTLEMAGERELMLNATKQYLMLRNIMDLSREVKQADARPMVNLFFKQMEGDNTRKLVLEKETAKFSQQIINRAIEKKREMVAEMDK